MDTPVDIITPLPSTRNTVSTAAKLKFEFSFGDFYRRDGLVRLDQVFLRELEQADAALHGQLLAARNAAEPPAAKAESELLLALAPHLDDFIGQLFNIEAEVRALSAQHHKLAPLSASSACSCNARPCTSTRRMLLRPSTALLSAGSSKPCLANH
jgi:hypothetical protein